MNLARHRGIHLCAFGSSEGSCAPGAGAIEGLRAQLNGIARIPMLAGYRSIEQRTVTARELRVQVQYLREKYVGAAGADGEIRKHLRDAAVARVNRPKG